MFFLLLGQRSLHGKEARGSGCEEEATTDNMNLTHTIIHNTGEESMCLLTTLNHTDIDQMIHPHAASNYFDQYKMVQIKTEKMAKPCLFRKYFFSEKL